MKSWHYERRLNRANADGERSVGFGVRVGYWPCKKGPYLQLAFYHHRLDIWWGL